MQKRRKQTHITYQIASLWINHWRNSRSVLRWHKHGDRVVRGWQCAWLRSPPPRCLCHHPSISRRACLCVRAGTMLTRTWTQSRLQLLSEVYPQLVYRFIEQTMQPGPSVSLKCSASGNPTPQISWTLDGFPLPHGNDRWERASNKHTR